MGGEGPYPVQTTQHLSFIDASAFVTVPRITKTWDVRSSGAYLGEVKWYAHWRRYCFFPDEKTIFDGTCLVAIANFCDRETQNRKDERKIERATLSGAGRLPHW